MEITFKKVHTGKDLIISAIVLVAGIGLYFLNAGLGVVTAACGALLLLLYKTGYKRKDYEGPVFTKKIMDVAYSNRQTIKDFLDGKDVEPDLSATGKGGVVCLEVYYNKNTSQAYAQLFDFSDYNYEKATEIIELNGPRAELLISKI